MQRLRATLQVAHPDLKLLITDPMGNDHLKTLLPATPAHPRALLTLLEGLAFRSGHPLTAAVAAANRSGLSLDDTLFGGGVWPDESALVRFELGQDLHRPRRIRGPGDFRQLYLLDRVGRS